MKYDALLSYAHTSKKTPQAIQNALEKLAKSLFKRKALTVLHDETNLGASPHLWADVAKALSQSNYIVLLASPQAVKSPWIEKEIKYWLENKDPNKLLSEWGYRGYLRVLHLGDLNHIIHHIENEKIFGHIPESPLIPN